ncbi:MAG: 1,6-anhydro-N-acetylmuramyl-L-alanine amidase AmpD [Pseudomonadota bacterium]
MAKFDCDIDNETGWLSGARRCPSPNADTRPPGVAPELIVVHGISLPPGQFGGPWIDRLFRNELPEGVHPALTALRSLRVSAHLLIRRDGACTQYVPLHRRAWHAGVSTFAHRTGCNDFSVGIELEGTDAAPYEPVQYRVLARVCLALQRRWPAISRDRIVGHSDIAPGRKSDPGEAFEWSRLMRELDSLTSETGHARPQ